jgi:hypothetical protein
LCPFVHKSTPSQPKALILPLERRLSRQTPSPPCPAIFAPSTNCPVAPEADLSWKRTQHKPSALADSLHDGTSKLDVSGIETAVTKHRSQKWSHCPIQPKEGPGRSRYAASVAARLYI